MIKSSNLLANIEHLEIDLDYHDFLLALKRSLANYAIEHSLI